MQKQNHGRVGLLKNVIDQRIDLVLANLIERPTSPQSWFGFPYAIIDRSNISYLGSFIIQTMSVHVFISLNTRTPTVPMRSHL